MAVIDFRFVYRDGAATGAAVAAYKLADTEAELPASVEGDIGWAKDRDCPFYYTGTVWLPLGKTGTWTPVITSGGGGAPTYTTQVGRYTQYGRHVHIDVQIALATKGTLAAGAVYCSLPFTSANFISRSPLVIGPFAGMTTAIVLIHAGVFPAQNYFDFNIATGATVGVGTMLVADIGANFSFAASGWYEIP